MKLSCLFAHEAQFFFKLTYPFREGYSHPEMSPNWDNPYAYIEKPKELLELTNELPLYP